MIPRVVIVLFLMALNASLHADILYVLGTNKIEKYSTTGTDLGTFANHSLSYPAGLAFDSTGNLYAANQLFGPYIEKFSLGGVDLGHFASGPSLNLPTGIAVDGIGNLYVANQGATSVERFSSLGLDLGQFATGLNLPVSPAFDSAGNLFVTNHGTNTVERFSPAGTDIGAFVSGGLSNPTSILFDQAGNLYVQNNFIGILGISTTTSWIEKFSPSGVDLGVFANTGSVFPSSLAFDSTGNLYAAINNTIEKFSASGTDLGVFASGLNGASGLAFTDDSGIPLVLPPTPIPEPSTFCLLGMGAAFFATRRARRSATQRKNKTPPTRAFRFSIRR